MESTNFINAETYIEEENINENIRIINSFENAKKENKWKDGKIDNIKENEKEIKCCEIKINGESILFLIYINLIKVENIIFNIHFQMN